MITEYKIIAPEITDKMDANSCSLNGCRFFFSITATFSLMNDAYKKAANIINCMVRIIIDIFLISSLFSVDCLFWSLALRSRSKDREHNIVKININANVFCKSIR